MAIHIKKFDTHADYSDYEASEGKITPNVSACIQENEVHYNKKVFDNQYLTIEALENLNVTIKMNSGVSTSVLTSLSYSLDDGETWSTTQNVNNQIVTMSIPQIQSGQRIMLKGSGASLGENGNTYNSVPTGCTVCSVTGRFNLKGNIMSLLYGDDFLGEKTLEHEYSFSHLFKNCSGLTSIENLSLPATTLADFCYSYMFTGCTSLANSTELPATTATRYCYSHMFGGCESLVKAPKLPATTLADYCYESMFNGCTSLVKAPELPATSVVDASYRAMFDGCTSLAKAPELPATTVGDWGYTSMFNGCSSLVAAPELPAESLGKSCYYCMFQHCTSLKKAPTILPATTLGDGTLYSGCYNLMFGYCPSLVVAPILPAPTLKTMSYGSMFRGCTSLKSITCLATDISASDCLNSWVENVSPNGVFKKAASMTAWPSGVSGIPEGWTVQDA